MFGRKKLKKRIAELESQVSALNKSIEFMRPISAYYTLTPSDFNKFGNNHKGMEAEAKRRLAGFLARQIIKSIGATEVVQEGKLSGYKIELIAGIAPEYR
jgi:hypothetical protein